MSNIPFIFNSFRCFYKKAPLFIYIRIISVTFDKRTTSIDQNVLFYSNICSSIDSLMMLLMISSLRRLSIRFSRVLRICWECSNMEKLNREIVSSPKVWLKTTVWKWSIFYSHIIIRRFLRSLHFMVGHRTISKWALNYNLSLSQSYVYNIAYIYFV